MPLVSRCDPLGVQSVVWRLLHALGAIFDLCFLDFFTVLAFLRHRPRLYFLLDCGASLPFCMLPVNLRSSGLEFYALQSSVTVDIGRCGAYLGNSRIKYHYAVE
jgi:hypothetical protein